MNENKKFKFFAILVFHWFLFSAALWHDKIAFCLFRSRQGQTSLVFTSAFQKTHAVCSFPIVEKFRLYFQKKMAACFPFGNFLCCYIAPRTSGQMSSSDSLVAVRFFFCGVSAKHDISRHPRYAMNSIDWVEPIDKVDRVTWCSIQDCNRVVVQWSFHESHLCWAASSRHGYKIIQDQIIVSQLVMVTASINSKTLTTFQSYRIRLGCIGSIWSTMAQP